MELVLDDMARRSYFALTSTRSPISNINIEACTFYDTVKDGLIDHVSDLKLKQVYCNGQF